MTKKIFAMFLAVLMVVSMLPTSVFAAELECPGANKHTPNNCNNTVISVVDPTCVERGYTLYQCTDCKDTFIGSWVAVSENHEWEDAPYQAPTCGAVGYEGGQKCKVCNKREGSEEIPALGVAPEGEQISCEYGDWDNDDFNCVEDFTTTKTCIHCGHEVTEEFVVEDDFEDLFGSEDVEHVYGPWVVVSDTTLRRTCTHSFGEWDCGAYEEKTAVDTHLHFVGGAPVENLMLLVEGKDAECEKAGMEDYYICRVCDMIFNMTQEETTLEDLVIPSLHDELKEELDCLSTTAFCNECEEYVAVGSVNHDWNPWVVSTDPSCVSAGFRYRECAVSGCPARETEIIEPLGHEEYTWTESATCVQFGYSFTYCVRPNCTVTVYTTTSKNNGTTPVTFSLTVGHNVLTAPMVDLPFALQLTNSLYLNVDDSDLSVSHSASTVTLVTAEDADGFAVEGTYYISVDTDKYLATMWEEVDGENVLKFCVSATPAVFTWNETLKTLTTVVEVGEAKVEYAMSFDAEEDCLVAVEAAEAETVAAMYITNAGGVKLRSITPNFTAGKNADNHNEKFEMMVDTDSTCQIAGTQIKRCTECNTVLPTVTKPLADHDWIDDTTKSGDNVVEDCTTAGKYHLVCDYCGETKVKNVDALGHTPEMTEDEDGNEIIKVKTHAGDHQDLVAYDYYYCTECNQEYNKHNIRAWAGASAIYADEDAAKDDHGDNLVRTSDEEAADVAGDCITEGYEVHKCTVCGQKVRIKEEGTGAHDPIPAANVIAPTCTTKGYKLSYQCSCGAIIGHASEVGKKYDYVDALGHDWEENEDYVASTCENPNLDTDTNYARSCKRTGCGHKDHDYIDVRYVAATAPLCQEGSYSYTEFTCKAHNTVHFYNLVGNFGHVYGEEEEVDEPDCEAPGLNQKTCIYCGDVEDVIVPALGHVNKAGVTFTKYCLDKNFDRHCVRCCDCIDENGVQTAHTSKTCAKNGCDCVLEKEVHKEDDIFVPATCDTYAYLYTICTECHKTTEVIEFTKDSNGDAIVLGHMPEKADEEGGVIKYYYGYTYEEFTPVVYTTDTDAAGKTVLVKSNGTPYMAKYIQYKETTDTEAGVVEFVCQVCGETHHDTPKPTGKVFFKAEIVEGDYTYGSLVEVIVAIYGANQLVDGFEIVVKADNMVYVGYESVSVENGTVVADLNADDDVQVYGWYKQNVMINDEVTLVKLTYRVTENSNTEDALSVEVASASVEYTDEEGEHVEVTAGLAEASEADVRMMLDVTGDDAVTFRDLAYMAQMIESGEYDVVCDINHNGEIDLQDLVEARKLYVGTVTVEELAAKYLPLADAKVMFPEDYCTVHNAFFCTDASHI